MDSSSSRPSKPSKFSIRTEHRHSGGVASLAVGNRGFTLCDGRESVTYEGGSLDHSVLVREISKAGVKRLYVHDAKTCKKVCDLRESYPHLFENLTVIRKKRLTRPDANCCPRCRSERCHRWIAVSLMSEVLKTSLDHPVHE